MDDFTYDYIAGTNNYNVPVTLTAATLGGQGAVEGWLLATEGGGFMSQIRTSVLLECMRTTCFVVLRKPGAARPPCPARHPRPAAAALQLDLLDLLRVEAGAGVDHRSLALEGA